MIKEVDLCRDLRKTVDPLKQSKYFGEASMKPGYPLAVIGFEKNIDGPCFYGSIPDIFDLLLQYKMADPIKDKVLSKVVLISFYLLSIVSAFPQIIDQQFHTNHFTNEDITGNPVGSNWLISGAPLPSLLYFEDCSGSRIFGGFEKLSGSVATPTQIQKNYINLPPHFQVRIQMKVYKIDSWINEKLFILLDGITKFTYTWDSTVGTSDICGNPNPITDAFNTNFKQQSFFFDQTFLHSAQTLSFTMVSSLDSIAGSWGFRQFTLTLERCDETCQTCDSLSGCTSCGTVLSAVGAFCDCWPKTKLLEITQDCLQTVCATCNNLGCSAGFYEDTTLSMCVPCHKACLTCTGALNIYGVCDSCSPGYVSLNDGVNPKCKQCFADCATCTGINFNECTTCEYGSFLVNSQCLDSCPIGFYPLQSQSICLACISPCITCFGSVNGNCLTCESGTFFYEYYCDTVCPSSLYAYNLTCVQNCPLGTYSDALNLCQDCPNALCLTCNSVGDCLSCLFGAFINPIDLICYNSCPDGYYGDNSSGICVICDLNCLTCFGPSFSQCQSCHPGNYLLSNICYSQCPTHTYPNLCEQCHDSCLNCTGPSEKQCTSCVDNYYLHLNYSTCILECEWGQITNHLQKTCQICENGKIAILDVCVDCNPSCLNCNGRLYCDCTECVDRDEDNKKIVLESTFCVFEDTNIIYVPFLQKSGDVLISSITIIVVITVSLSIILQCLFVHKTNLLIFVQMMQILSYFYYLCPPMSTSTQKILILMYNFHPSAILQLNIQIPSLQLPTHPLSSIIFPKALIMEKTGIFLLDSLVFHGLLILLILTYGIAKANKGYLYSKINPYIISYGYRLLFMEHIFCIILFLIYLDLTNDFEIGSLILCILDFILFGMSFFWKVKTSSELSHAHYALFYFNQLGTPRGSYEELAPHQTKQKKSILPSLIFFVGKFPIIFIIFFFYKQPITQGFCLLIYTLLLGGVHIAIEYRRKIMKAMSYYMHSVLIIASIFMLALAFQIDVSLYFDLFLLIVVIIPFLMTLFQALSNYLYFISLYYKGKQKLSQCFSSEP